MTNKQAAIKIIKRLQDNGFEALLAGGCVRDMLLARPAKDYDVATSAAPDEVTGLFQRTLKVGAQFGVVVVMVGPRQVEVATFRAEDGYDDHRHPTEVRFVSAAEDAARRDFTINGMFYDPLTERVIDYVEGQVDLKKRLIRTIGDPNERFDEDYLRMLRAVRFSTQLDFGIDPETWSAVCGNASKITRISAERVAAELEQMLTHPNRAVGASMLVDCGLAQAIFPGVFTDPAAGWASVLGRLRTNVDFGLALTALFVDCDTPVALEAIRTLKLSRNRLRHVQFLLDHRGVLLDESMSLAQLKMLLAEPYFWDLYELQRAIQKAADAEPNLSGLIALRRRIRDLGDVDFKPKPLLNGHDLMDLGAVPGPSLGRLAQEMYIAQLEGEVRTPEEARAWVTTWLKQHRNGVE